MFSIFKKIYWVVFSTHQWFILYRVKEHKEWIKLPQPKNVSRADSFVIYENGCYYIFFEEFDIKQRHGYLCVGRLNQDKNILEDIEIILKEEYHLSFPNVFKEQNKYYMIPESHANNSVDLYEFIEFPYKLKKTKTLLKGNYADSILLNFNSKWFLFTNKSEENSDLHSRNLSIFISNNLNEEFNEYHQNPVVLDNEFARMGGEFIKKDNKLYRVSQDCKTRYGYKINIMEVDILDEMNYEEHCIEMIYPPKGYIAFHTLNSANKIEVADAKVIIVTFETLLYGIKNIFNIVKGKLDAK